MKFLLCLTAVTGIGIGAVALAPVAASAQMTPFGTGPITRAQYLQWFQQQLDAADANHDGVVSLDEQRTYRQVRCAQVAGALFDTVDVNHNGQVTREELVTFFTAQADPSQTVAPNGKLCSSITRGWEMLGHNKDGSITIKQALADADKRFRYADVNNDGVVDPVERKAFRRNPGFHQRMPAVPSAPGN